MGNTSSTQDSITDEVRDEKKMEAMEDEMKKKMEVLEEMKKKMEKSQTKKGQSRRLERSKSKHSKPRDSLGRWVAMGPSSERETEKEEMVKESLSQEETGGTFEERYVGALESLADSMEDLVRIVMTRMRWWLWLW